MPNWRVMNLVFLSKACHRRRGRRSLSAAAIFRPYRSGTTIRWLQVDPHEQIPGPTPRGWSEASQGTGKDKTKVGTSFVPDFRHMPVAGSRQCVEPALLAL